MSGSIHRPFTKRKFAPPPYVPRAYIAGIPEVISSTVLYTISSRFCVCFPMRSLPRTPMGYYIVPFPPPPPRFPYFPMGVCLSLTDTVRSEFHLRLLSCAFRRQLVLSRASCPMFCCYTVQVLRYCGNARFGEQVGKKYGI